MNQAFEHRLVAKAPSERKAALDSLKTLARNAGIVLAGLALSKLITYLYKLVIARSGADFFGKFSLGYAVFDIAAMLAGLGLAVGLYRFVPEYAGNGRRLNSLVEFAFKAGAFSGVAASIALFFSADLITQLFFQGDSQVALVIRILAFAIPFFVLQNILVAVMQGLKRMDLVAFSKNVLENAFKLGAAAFALFGGALLLGWSALAGLSAGFVAALFLAFVVSFFLVRTLLPPWKQSVRVPTGVGRELLYYSLPLLLSLALNSVVTWADTLFLGFFRTPAETGVFNAALTTSLFLLIAPGVVASLNLQLLVEMQERGRREAAQKVFGSVSKWIFFLNFPLFLYLTVFSWQVMNVLYGGEYTSGGSALVVLGLGYLLYSVAQPAFDAIAALKRSDLVLQNSIASALASVGLNYLLVPSLGVLGAAISTGAAISLFALLSALQANRMGGYPLLSRDYLKAIAAGVIAIAGTYFFAKIVFGPMALWLLVLVSGAYGIAYLSVLFLLKAFDDADIELLKAAEKKVGFKFLAPVREFAKYYYKKN